jgi:hypothetical protein
MDSHSAGIRRRTLEDTMKIRTFVLAGLALGTIGVMGAGAQEMETIGGGDDIQVGCYNYCAPRYNGPDRTRCQVECNRVGGAQNMPR